ncbi:uncharacterized protein LOC133203938 [Saccostrea echinata]|uniref:uncharacterized protein LOC133203938 n=1 Tax=Saccostrea echinata TaxID=191078 RepID=UPI002A82464E|nr:uncharacterized protein LOC133203938 [Saccostrea echinata]
MASDMKCGSFALSMFSEIIDLFLDWDFFYEVNKSSVVENNVKSAIQGFAILGTVLFVFTFISQSCDACSDDEEENPCTPTLSLVSTALEDFPQIILAIIVAMHTSELISWIQISKALYGIIEPAIRITVILEERENSRQNFRESPYLCAKHCDMCISGIILMCSIALLFELAFDFFH